jgi:hypothetical protein
MSQQRPRGGLNIAPPPLGLDKSGNIDLRAMLDQGIIPKRELATAMVRKFFSGVVFRLHEMNTKVQWYRRTKSKQTQWQGQQDRLRRRPLRLEASSLTHI